MRTLPWPEMESEHRPNRTIRSLLDYLTWISNEMLTPGFHSGSIRTHWARQTERAYRAMFIPMVIGHGDPYPPNIPAAHNPGTWPDLPSASIPGMTLRHQLSVIHRVFEDLRDRTSPLLRPRQVKEWDRRLQLAMSALHHGDGYPMPEEASTDSKKAAVEQQTAKGEAAKKLAAQRVLAMQKSMSAGAMVIKKPVKPKPPRVIPPAPPPKKKAAKKKASAKKVPAKKAPTKKKTVAKKKAAAPKKAPAKKKTATKKTAAKPPASKAPKKKAAKKSPAKKVVAKKTHAKKVAKKKAVKKGATKKAPKK